MTDGPPATATKSGAPDPLIGRVIAERFKIVELIARGGMGKVYRAEQAPLGRVCALKILNPNYNGDADPEFHRRFFREASIASKITHPNSVTIFDYGTDNEIYYMAMEYLEGQTLHQALRDAKTIPEERAGRIAQQICRALREAHLLGVIHRDLKPANIFLTRHGDDEDFVKVLDFGLVKHISERPEEQLTQTGLFMGSPKYMAPEQIQGGVVDARTDVYSLGIIMYEMVAGKVPFDRPTSVNILMAHVGEPPPRMREVNPNLVCSPGFEELVMRCIAKDPAERFRSMDEVLQAIRRVHGGTMTGQLAAVVASGSYTPPPARSSGSSVPLPVVSSGSHTPMGMLRADPTDTPAPVLDSDMMMMQPRRSRAWIALGVVVAAAVGGVLGMAAFRMTAASRVPVRTTTASTATSGATASTANNSNASSSNNATTTPASAGADTGSGKNAGDGTVLHVVTDPPGANVREDGAELCIATPCDVTFKGDAADPKKTHRLTILKLGFRVETKAVHAGDPPVNVRLTRAPAGAPVVRPPVVPQQPPTTPPTAPKPDPTATPNGFKDLPY